MAPHSPGDLRGQTWLLTGSNDGIGYETARGLVAMGAHLLVHARDRQKAEQTVGRLRAEAPQAELQAVAGDLSSQAQVRALAAQVRAPVLHGLLHNAGALMPEHGLTEDGVERQLAINHLAPFLLTRLLWPQLTAGGPVPLGQRRVVVVASMAHYKGQIDWTDLHHSRGRYNPQTVYRSTKLCNVLFAAELARRARPSGVAAFSLHPGVVSTRIAGKMAWWAGLAWALGRPFMIGPEEGAATSLHAAASPELAGQTGLYLDRCREKRPSALAQDPELARRLWAESCALVGEPDWPASP